MTAAAGIGTLAGVVVALLASTPTTIRAQAWVLDPATVPAIYQESAALLGAAFTPLSDGRLLAYGAFSHVDGRRIPGLALVRTSGVTDPAFAAEVSAADRVTAAAPLTEGRILTVISKAPQTSIPVYYPTGDGVLPAPVPVDVNVRRDDTVSVIGFPSSFVRLRADGRRDPAYIPLACDGGPNVTPLADSRIIVWGSYRTLGGAPRNSLARLNADGSLDPTYTPVLAAVPVAIMNLAAGTDGSVVASGFFYDSNSVIAYFFKRIGPDGTVESHFAPARVTTTFSQLAVQSDGSVLTGNGTLTRYSLTGAADPSYNSRVPTRNNGVTRIAPLPNSRLAVQSYYTAPSGYALTGVFILGPDGELERDFQAEPGAPNSHRLLTAFPNGRLLLLRSNATLAVTYGDPIAPTDPAIASAVAATAASTGATIDTVVPIYVEPTEAAAELAVTPDPKSPAVPFGFNPTLRTAAYLSRLDADERGRVFASGRFTHVAGQPRPGFARFLASGAFDPSFAPAAGTLQLVLPDGRVIVRQSGKLMRLRDDGSVDSGFSVPAALDKDTTRVLAAAPDGRLLISVLEPDTSSEASLKLVWLGPSGERLATLPTVFGGFGYWTSVYYINPQPITPPPPPGVGPISGGGTSSSALPATATTATADITAAAVAAAAGATTAAGTPTPEMPGILVPIPTLVPMPIPPFGPIAPPLSFVATNAINAARLLPDGRLLVTGSFRSVGNTARNGVAWIDADGSLVPFAADPPLSTPTTPVPVPVRVVTNVAPTVPLPLPDGTALVFDTVVERTVSRTRARRLRDDGTFDPEFAPAPGSMPTTTRLLSDGSFFGNGRRLLPSTALDLNFAPVARFGTANAPIIAAAIANTGHLWIGGYFDTIDGQPRASLARYESREIVGFTFPPTSQTLVTGRTATFTSVLGTNQPATYRWTLNGATIAGATDANLVVANTNAASAGDYCAVVTIAGREIASPPATLTLILNTSRLQNFSARGLVSPTSPLVAGFVASAVAPRPVLLRAVGRGLPLNNIATVTVTHPGPTGLPHRTLTFSPSILPDPILSAFRGAELLATDRGSATAAAFVALGRTVGGYSIRTYTEAPASTNYGSALAPAIGGGVHSAMATSGDGSSGLCLIEGYDTASFPTAALLRNVSVLGRVAAGADALAAGFVHSGNGPLRFLIRGLGPALAAVGVSGAISDPQLRLFPGANGSPFDMNSNGAATATILDVTRRVGAFPLPAGSGDSALLLTLEPGAYTAQLASASGATGTGMIEIYVVE